MTYPWCGTSPASTPRSRSLSRLRQASGAAPAGHAGTYSDGGEDPPPARFARCQPGLLAGLRPFSVGRESSAARWPQPAGRPAV